MYERLTYPMYYQHGENGWSWEDESTVPCAKFARLRMVIPERVSPVPAHLAAYEDAWSVGSAFGTSPNLVNFNVRPSLTYETSYVQLETLRGSVSAAQRVFRRRSVGSVDSRHVAESGVRVRLPCSRWQLSPWLSQEHALDAYCRTEEQRMRFYRNNQSMLLRHSADANEGQQRVVLPPSHLGGKRFMRNKTAEALTIVSKRGRPFFFITITTNNEWKEIQSRIPHNASPYDHPEVRVLAPVIFAVERADGADCGACLPPHAASVSRTPVFWSDLGRATL